MILYDPETRREWLSRRQGGIGGSDAACVVGLNKYKTNVQLWEEKTGLSTQKDISNQPAVAFGVAAEPIIRDLFRVEHPEYDIAYHPYRMYAKDHYNWLYATLDGELQSKDGSGKGILEIKTCTIQNSTQWEEWNNQLPQNYYVQVLHQLLATGWDFVCLCAYLRYTSAGTPRKQIREYTVTRSDVLDDLEWLLEKEETFWQMVQAKEKPALILPEI